jgi:Amt family ammonium transporter
MIDEISGLQPFEGEEANTMSRKTFIVVLIVFLLVGYTATCALADTAADPKQVAMDTGWVLIAAVLVMFMQAGFAMLTAGFSRSKNACNMLMKNLMDFCFGSLAFWAVGFGLMFGAGNLLFGTSGFFL